MSRDETVSVHILKMESNDVTGNLEKISKAIAKIDFSEMTQDSKQELLKMLNVQADIFKQYRDTVVKSLVAITQEHADYVKLLCKGEDAVAIRMKAAIAYREEKTGIYNSALAQLNTAKANAVDTELDIKKQTLELKKQKEERLSLNDAERKAAKIAKDLANAQKSADKAADRLAKQKASEEAKIEKEIHYWRMHYLDKQIKAKEDALKQEAIIEKKALADSLRRQKKLYSDIKGIAKSVGKFFTFGWVVQLNQAVELLKSGFSGLRSIIGGTISQFIKAASVAENYTVRLESIFGSTQIAKNVYQDMATLASNLPYTFEEVLSSATNLAPILTNNIGLFKDTRDELKYWMTNLVPDLAAVSGLTLEETTSNLIKLYSAGAASADLFRERGINAMLGFIPKFSYTAEESIKKIYDAVNSGSSVFSGVAERLKMTWDGQISMIQDKWFNFKKELMDEGIFSSIKATLVTANNMFDLNRDKIKSWVKTIGSEINDKLVTVIQYALSKLDNISGEDILQGFKSIVVGFLNVVRIFIDGLGIVKDVIDFVKNRSVEKDSGNKKQAQYIDSGIDHSTKRLKQFEAELARIEAKESYSHTNIFSKVFGIESDAVKEVKENIRLAKEQLQAYYKMLEDDSGIARYSQNGDKFLSAFDKLSKDIESVEKNILSSGNAADKSILLVKTWTEQYKIALDKITNRDDLSKVLAKRFELNASAVSEQNKLETQYLKLKKDSSKIGLTELDSIRNQSQELSIKNGLINDEAEAYKEVLAIRERADIQLAKLETKRANLAKTNAPMTQDEFSKEFVSIVSNETDAINNIATKNGKNAGSLFQKALFSEIISKINDQAISNYFQEILVGFKAQFQQNELIAKTTGLSSSKQKEIEINDRYNRIIADAIEHGKEEVAIEAERAKQSDLNILNMKDEIELKRALNNLQIEFKSIGLTDYQKQINAINQEYNDVLQNGTEQQKEFAKSIRDAKIETLDKNKAIKEEIALIQHQHDVQSIGFTEYQEYAKALAEWTNTKKKFLVENPGELDAANNEFNKSKEKYFAQQLKSAKSQISSLNKEMNSIGKTAYELELGEIQDKVKKMAGAFGSTTPEVRKFSELLRNSVDKKYAHTYAKQIETLEYQLGQIGKTDYQKALSDINFKYQDQLKSTVESERTHAEAMVKKETIILNANKAQELYINSLKRGNDLIVAGIPAYKQYAKEMKALELQRSFESKTLGQDEANLNYNHSVDMLKQLADTGLDDQLYDINNSLKDIGKTGYERSMLNIAESTKYYEDVLGKAHPKVIALKRAMELLAKNDYPQTFAEGWTAAISKMAEGIKSAGEMTKDAIIDSVQIMNNSFSSVIDDLVDNKMESFKEYFASFLKDIAKMLIDTAVKVLTAKAIVALGEFVAGLMGNAGSAGSTGGKAVLDTNGSVVGNTGSVQSIKAPDISPNIADTFNKSIPQSGSISNNNAKASQPITMTVNISNSDEKGVLNALPKLRQTILDTVNSEIASNGSTIQMIRNYA